MRLKSVYINNYKNLKNFTLTFDGTSFIDVFVGKNGSGKSNFFEAVIEIFRHLYEFDKKQFIISFDYKIIYEINKHEIVIESKSNKLKVNGTEDDSVKKNNLPDNVLIYYSGHNEKVKETVNKYEDAFKSRIKKANINESRKFIGIGNEYKQILLIVLLLQNEKNKAKDFIKTKLGIKKIAPEFKLVLKRPSYASKDESKKYNIELNDENDKYWKADGIVRTFLDRISKCISAESKSVRTEGYLSNDDKYILYIDIKKFLKEFAKSNSQELFQQFDNLRLIDMLQEVSIKIILENGIEATIDQFSDGQFQSIYIYSIIEIFKDRNCITLLDEPDSFLHPEWQFDFLKQVIEIADSTSKNNHVLMSSHSAATLIPHSPKKIKFFEIKQDHVNSFEIPKHVAIKKLSSDLIKYSEKDQLLSIINTIQIEKKPVLFTEGYTDPLILKTAWYKLYEEEMPFIPFYAFSCTYICQLLTDSKISVEIDGLPIFGLFDFDKAYNQWNGLDGQVIQNDPYFGLVKKWASGESYAIMLPIPKNAVIQKQVIKNPATKVTYKDKSNCEIEHLFYGSKVTKDFYIEEECLGGGHQIVFISDSKKIEFAKDIVPLVENSYFEVFRNLFEFIKSKCNVATDKQ